MTARVTQTQETLRRRILVENVSSYLAYRASEMSEGEFLAELAQHSGCGILLDINNLFVNAGNHGFDASEALAAFPAEHVGEIHLAGHTGDGRPADRRPRVPGRPGGVDPLRARMPPLRCRACADRMGQQHPVARCARRQRRTPPRPCRLGKWLTSSQIQGQLARALDGAGALEPSPPLFVGDEHDVARRLAVYRGNLLATSGHALAAAYPVIVQVVGAEFFEALARAYLAHSPSTSGDLNQYGMQFACLPGGLSARPRAAVSARPRASRVGRAQRALRRRHRPARCLAPGRGAGGGSSRVCACELNPLCALLESRYPLARIWEIHQKDYGGEFSVQFHDGPFRALVSRPRFRAQAVAIGAGEYEFLAASAAGATLSEALDTALRADPGFALDAALHAWVEARVVVDSLSRGASAGPSSADLWPPPERSLGNALSAWSSRPPTSSAAPACLW